MGIELDTGDILRCSYGTYWANQAGINTVHYRVLSTVDGLESEDVALRLDTLMAPLYKPLLTNTASYYGVRVSKVLPLPLYAQAISAEFVGSGTSGTTPLPGQVSGIISLRTLFGGRKGRGRVFIPFPDETESDTDANKPDGTYIVKLSALADVMLGTITVTVGGLDAFLEPVLINRATGDATIVTGYTAQIKWATQRRRGSYGQANVYPPF